jgi:hypothetical protein
MRWQHSVIRSDEEKRICGLCRQRIVRSGDRVIQNRTANGLFPLVISDQHVLHHGIHTPPTSTDHCVHVRCAWKRWRAAGRRVCCPVCREACELSAEVWPSQWKLVKS